MNNFEFSYTIILFILFIIHSTASYLFSYDVSRNNDIYVALLKTFIFCFIMNLLLTSRYRIHIFIIVLSLGLSIHGIIEGEKYIVTFGWHKVNGITKYGDNNHFALVMTMIFPLIIYLYSYSSYKISKVVAVAVAVIILAAIIGTSSRGGLLALVCTCTWMTIVSKKKALGALSLTAFIALACFAPDAWRDRMNTINSAGQDTSFMGRVVAWKISSAIAMENPLTGGGFHAIENQTVWDQFRNADGLLGFVDTPEADHFFHAAHSAYFEILGDLGFIGVALFCLLILNIFRTRMQLLRLTRQNPQMFRWALDLADMIGASTVGYIVGASALSAGYYEIFYTLAMLMEALRRCVSAGVRNLPTQSNSLT